MVCFSHQTNGYSLKLIYAYRVSIKVKYWQRGRHKMEGTEIDAKNGMIGDGPKHRTQATWYLLLLLLFEMVLSNGRYPLHSHRALHKPTFPSAPTTGPTGSIHTPSPVSGPDMNMPSRMSSTKRSSKPTVAFLPWCQALEQLQLLLAMCAPWVAKLG